MKAYRMKHKPTGLYFCPSREVRVKLPNGKVEYVKSNLSKCGKLYVTQPSFSWIGKYFYNPMLALSGQVACRNGNYLSPFRLDEWEIEEVE